MSFEVRLNKFERCSFGKVIKRSLWKQLINLFNPLEIGFPSFWMLSLSPSEVVVWDLFDRNQLFKVFQAVSYGYICWLTETKADSGWSWNLGPHPAILLLTHPIEKWFSKVFITLACGVSIQRYWWHLLKTVEKTQFRCTVLEKSLKNHIFRQESSKLKLNMVFETFLLNGTTKLNFLNYFEQVAPRPLDRHPTS